MEKLKILIVEDEAIIAKDLEWHLQEMGYNPSIATTGEDAFNKAKEFNPDLVLMDIILPGQIDGIEAANKIRSMADIPVVYLTAYADESILDRAVKTEPFGYLIKPVEHKELQSTIKMAIYKHNLEKKLKESEERYRLLVENQNELIVKLDSDFRILFASPNFCRFFGKTEKDLVGNEFMPLRQKKEHNRLKKTLKLFLEKSPYSTYYEEQEEATEGRRWIGWSVKGVIDKSNMIKEIVVVGRDITDQKLKDKALRKSHKVLINVLDGIDAIVYVADMKTYEILYVNKYTRNIFGDLKGEVCWKTLQTGQSAPCDFCTNDKLVTPDGRPCGAYRWEFRNTLNGRWYDIRDRAIEWIDGRIVRLEIATDITYLKEGEELLRSMSFVDDLTGLYNRRGFLTLANQQIKAAERDMQGMALLFADLDNLKWINDAMGHIAGDRALTDIASILKETFRESDIIARIGGDEFVILARETREINIESLTSRLHAQLAEYNIFKGGALNLSLSIGTVRYDPRHPYSIDELLKQADTLMYKHKKSKRHLN